MWTMTWAQRHGWIWTQTCCIGGEGEGGGQRGREVGRIREGQLQQEETLIDLRKTRLFFYVVDGEREDAQKAVSVVMM